MLFELTVFELTVFAHLEWGFPDAFADVHVWQDVISLICYSQETGGEGEITLWSWINTGTNPFLIENISEVSMALGSWSLRNRILQNCGHPSSLFWILAKGDFWIFLSGKKHKIEDCKWWGVASLKATLFQMNL